MNKVVLKGPGSPDFRKHFYPSKPYEQLREIFPFREDIWEKRLSAKSTNTRTRFRRSL